MIKALMILGIEGMYLTLIMAVYDGTIINIILDGDKLKKVRNETRVSILSTLSQMSQNA
jgi:hypothetical protein